MRLSRFSPYEPTLHEIFVHLVGPEGIELAVLLQVQGPEQQAKLGRCGLEESGHIDVEGAEAGAECAKLGAVILTQALHLLGDDVARQHAARTEQVDLEHQRIGIVLIVVNDQNRELTRHHAASTLERASGSQSVKHEPAPDVIPSSDDPADLRPYIRWRAGYDGCIGLDVKAMRTTRAADQCFSSW